MKKRMYRTVDVKRVDREQVWECWRGERLVIGVDAGKEKYVAALMDEGREVRQRVGWSHPEESLEVVEWLAGVPAAQVEVVLESTGTYADPVWWQFEQQGVAVYRVSTKRVRDAREVYDGVPSSHDGKSATLVGRLHLEGASERWQRPSEQRRELRAWVDLKGIYDRQVQSHQNRLEALVARHWPELLGLLALTTQSLARLLAEYGDPAQVAAAPEEARRLLWTASRGALKREKIEEVIASAWHTLGVAMVAGEREKVRALAREVLELRVKSQEVERGIAELVAEEPTASRMGAQVGEGTAAALVACLGSPQQYACARSYEKALGLNLKENSSGKRTGELSITKRGPGLARWYLYLDVLRWIQGDQVARRWYERKVARDGKKKSKALVALMRKRARGLWHVAQGEAFDSRKLFDVKRLGLA